MKLYKLVVRCSKASLSESARRSYKMSTFVFALLHIHSVTSRPLAVSSKRYCHNLKSSFKKKAYFNYLDELPIFFL